MFEFDFWFLEWVVLKTKTTEKNDLRMSLEKLICIPFDTLRES